MYCVHDERSFIYNKIITNLKYSYTLSEIDVRDETGSVRNNRHFLLANVPNKVGRTL